MSLQAAGLPYLCSAFDQAAVVILPASDMPELEADSRRMGTEAPRHLFLREVTDQGQKPRVGILTVPF